MSVVALHQHSLQYPPQGSQVAANATITLVFDYPVESVTDAIGAGKKWTITVVVI